MNSTVYLRAALFALAALMPVPASAQAVPAPGTVLASNGTSKSDPNGSQLVVGVTIGPYGAPAHVFLTAFGTAVGLRGGPVSLTTSIFVGSGVYAQNGDDYVSVATSSKLVATANYDFIMPKGVSVVVKATTGALPANGANKGDLKLFYRAIAVK